MILSGSSSQSLKFAAYQSLTACISDTWPGVTPVTYLFGCANITGLVAE